jgi:hypothetical protein
MYHPDGFFQIQLLFVYQASSNQMPWKFQFATAALVGILTACVLHGTSNLLFTLLNIAPGSSSSSSYQYSRSSSSYQDKKAQMRLQDMDAGGGGDYYESAPKEEEYDDGDASSSSTDFDNLLSEPASRRIRSDHPLVCLRIPETIYIRT